MLFFTGDINIIYNCFVSCFGYLSGNRLFKGVLETLKWTVFLPRRLFDVAVRKGVRIKTGLMY